MGRGLSPKNSRSVFHDPVLSDIMHDFLLKDGDSYYKLLDLFYVLKTMCADTKKSKTDPGIVSFKDVHEKRSRHLGEIAFLEDDLSGFFSITPKNNFEPNDYTNTITHYPAREFYEFTDMLENGEAVTWTDVSAFISKAHMSMESLI